MGGRAVFGGKLRIRCLGAGIQRFWTESVQNDGSRWVGELRWALCCAFELRAGPVGRGYARGLVLGQTAHLVFGGRGAACEIADEVIPAAAGGVRRVGVVPVRCVGDDQEIEILVGVHQGFDYKECVGHWHVVIHGAVHEEEVAFEVFGGELVGLIVIVGGPVGVADEETLPLLAPVILVEAVIVIAAFADADFEEVGEVEHGGCSSGASAGVAIDADARGVDPGEAGGELPDPGDLVGDGVVAHVPVVGVVECPGAERGAGAVDADDDKAQLGEGLHIAVGGGEGARAARAGLGAGVDEVDDGVVGGGVEVAGAEQKAVQVGLVVASFDCDGEGGTQPRDWSAEMS